MERQTHNLIQGSEEWHNFRAQHFGASEAAAMLGLSNDLTRNDLLRYKKTGQSKEYSDWVQKNILDYGHEVESKARAILLREGLEFFPVCCSFGTLSASCDGITIDYSLAFEHKQYNKDLFNFISENGILPASHMPQCQQILFVTGADKLLFVCSDGTKENWAEAEIYPDQEWIQRIISGWQHFEEDLKNYIHKPEKEKPMPDAIMQLPSLSIQLRGEVTQTNLPDFKVAAESFIANIKTDLQTDEDFANAEETVKFCDETERKLEAAKSAALAQTSSIDDVMRTIDFIKESIRSKRLTLEKLVKTQKEVIKKKIIDDGYQICVDYGIRVNPEFASLDFIALANNHIQRQRFEAVCKNKRTLSSLQNSVDAEVIAIKTSLDALAYTVKTNLAQLPADISLFRDLQQIITKQPEDFKLLVDYRLEEQARKEKEAAERAIEAERQRLEKEAQAKEIAEEKERQFAEQLKSKQEQEAIDLANAKIESGKKMMEDNIKPVIDMNPCVNIPVVDFKRLTQKEKILDALIASGVENWEGYEQALESLE